MSEALIKALEEMDPLDDEQWTTDGSPKIDVLKEATGEDVTRQMVLDAAPQFSRENPTVEVVSENNGESQGDPNDTEQEAEPFDLEAMLNMESLPDVQQFAAAMLLYDEDDADILDAIYEEMKAKEEALYVSIDDIKQRASDIAGLALIVQKRRNHVSPPMSDQQRRMAFIQSQTDLRMAKKKALDGIPLAALKKLDPRSPLDQAMAVKRQRQDQRPTKV